MAGATIWRVAAFAYYAVGCLRAWRYSPALSPLYWRTTVAGLRAQRLPALLAPVFILTTLAVDLAFWPYDWWRWHRLLRRAFPSPPGSSP